MFRIVTDFVQDPTLLLICDNRHCGCFVTKTIPAKTEAERSAAIEPFIAEVSQSGWIIALDQHLCPSHVKKLVEGRRLVEVPNLRIS